MRKFIMIAAMVLVSATAQAGAQLASNDARDATPADQTAKVDTPQQPRNDDRPQTRKHETQEAKARRIAARYGVYW